MNHSESPRGARGLFSSIRYPAIALTVVVQLLFPFALAQDRATGRIPTVTRLVRIISTLESELSAHARSGNQSALAQMLTDDFEMRIASNPGTPIPRDDWLREALAKPEPESRVEQMSVHEYGDIAVATFINRHEQAGSKKGSDGALFLVDVWKRSGDTWQLALRHAGPSGSSDFAPMGAGAKQPVIPKKY
jgi:ketosteroid isomerase-like protein